LTMPPIRQSFLGRRNCSSCGVGTTGQALRAGRPMLVIPHAFDQPDNAARLVRLGVARMLERQCSTASRIATELRTLLFGP
jgi:UDP:flavonoid glycosyltransferase YjiC (YdhE family)